jgi:hypothetical protein
VRKTKSEKRKSKNEEREAKIERPCAECAPLKDQGKLGKRVAGQKSFGRRGSWHSGGLERNVHNA